jgi:hypothetical protein
MNDETTLRAPLPDTLPPPAPESSPPHRYQRPPKGERVPSGKVLPPPPSWMMKPLKPPRARPPTND